MSVHFRHTGSGLDTSDGQPVKPLALRDGFGQWHTAAGVIAGSILHVIAPDCVHPVEVAYAWADNPLGAELANRDGYPATPFRLSC